jgi:hypothetical protein
MKLEEAAAPRNHNESILVARRWYALKKQIFYGGTGEALASLIGAPQRGDADGLRWQLA